MNRNYFKVALRRISRNYKSTLIIFCGLVIGLSSCMILYTKISYELSFDRSHTQRKNIYRVVRVTSGLEYTSGGLEYRTGVHFPYPAEIRKNIPELKNVTAMFYLYGQKILLPAADSLSEKSFDFDDGIVFTEPSFFEIFDYGREGSEWIAGEGKKVLDRPYTAVLTEGTAQRLFLNKNAIGRIIDVFGTRFTVEGVIKDTPQNSDFPFRVFLSMATFYEKLYPSSLTDWGSLSDGYQCYVVLNKRSNIKSIEEKLKETYGPHATGDYAERRLFKLQPLAQVHKEAKFGNYNVRTVSSGLILALTLTGFFIFLIACFNYSNFFLAETFRQKKQIALKLILGSKSASILLQLLTESVLVNLMALIFSLQLTFPLIRNFYSFIDIPEDYFPKLNLSVVLFLLGLLLAGGILSVIFSFITLKLKSLSALLKRIDSHDSGKENNFGKGSVILQFIVAQTVIIATLIIFKQIYFINHTNLGYNTRNIIIAQLPDNTPSRLSTLTNELNSVSGIKGVSFSSISPSQSTSWSSITLFNNNERKDVDVEIKSVDSSFIGLYAINLHAGHNFSSSDTASSVIVNEEFLIETGYKNINDVLGTRIMGLDQRGSIITGVVSDFYSGSLHEQIRPCVFINNPARYGIASIGLSSQGTGRRTKAGLPGSDLVKVSELWKKVFPDQPFNYYYLSDRIEDYYRSEHKALNLFVLFASITIFLCILGILGLSLSMNERRTKEIGIRKVNGAEVYEILALLNIDFLKWVVAAFIVAIPVSWFAMHKWLQNFAYKTQMNWWIFALAGLLALCIVLLTVSWQSWRAATRNPVEALRYE